jgi:uncharacterized membrane protein
MSSTTVTVLLWIAAISSGVITGVYFAFSAFIMPAFSKIKTTQSIAAMNSINTAILRSSFMSLFFGSSIISLCLIVTAFVHWGQARIELVLIAGIIYFIGMFISTVVFNVPLNNLLARTDPDSENARQVWSHYLNNWTKWNHLRTVSSLLTCILCIWLLSTR